MKYIKLRKELDRDKTLYAEMTNAQVADELNAINKTRPRSSISGSELLGYTDLSEYSQLSDRERQQWLTLCSIDVVPESSILLISSVFPIGTITWGNIVKTITKSRAAQLGFKKVSENDVKIARAY